MALDLLANDTEDEGIGDERTRVDDGFCLNSNGRVGGNILTQQIARAELPDAKVPLDPLCDCALARALFFDRHKMRRDKRTRQRTRRRLTGAPMRAMRALLLAVALWGSADEKKRRATKDAPLHRTRRKAAIVLIERREE